MPSPWYMRAMPACMGRGLFGSGPKDITGAKLLMNLGCQQYASKTYPAQAARMFPVHLASAHLPVPSSAPLSSLCVQDEQYVNAYLYERAIFDEYMTHTSSG